MVVCGSVWFSDGFRINITAVAGQAEIAEYTEITERRWKDGRKALPMDRHALPVMGSLVFI